MNKLLDVIKNRRAIYPIDYQAKGIPKEILLEILEAANWAPNHKRTEPWRFKIFHQPDARVKLGEQLASAMEVYTPAEKFSPMKQEKMRKKAQNSGCVIAICMLRDPEQSLPEWEEIAAVACAVQNMWLMASDIGIGAYWSSPSFLTQNNLSFLQMEEGERCLGLFYMGWTKSSYEPKPRRKPITDKVRWME